jgi:hypothetical protein
VNRKRGKKDASKGCLLQTLLKVEFYFICRNIETKKPQRSSTFALAVAFKLHQHPSIGTDAV